MEFYWEKFRELRKNNHISVNFLIKKMNISQPTLWLWEHGKRNPDERNIRLLSKITGIPLVSISDLKEDAQMSKLSPEAVSSTIIEPILFNSQNIKGAYESVLNIVSQLKKKSEQSTSLLKALLNSNNVMFYIKDKKLNYLAVNDIFLKTLSMSPDYIYLGKNDSIFFTTQEAMKNTSEDEQVLLKGITIKNREDFIPGTRKKQIGLISKFPIFDDVGTLIGVAATFIDITRRIINEKKNTILSEIIQNLPFGISVSSKDHMLTKEPFFINPTFKTFMFPDWNTLINHPELIVKRINPDDVNDFSDFINKHKYPRSICIRLSDESGKNEQWIKYAAHQIDKYFITTIEDISEQKRQEEINELLKIHINSANKAIVIINLDTSKYEYISKVREDIYGRKLDSFFKYGIDFWLNECVHPADRESARALLEQKTIQQRQQSILEFRIVRPDGEVRWIKKETSYIRFRTYNCVMLIEEDISEYKKKEEVKELLHIYINLLNKGVVIFDFKTRQFYTSGFETSHLDTQVKILALHLLSSSHLLEPCLALACFVITIRCHLLE